MEKRFLEAERNTLITLTSSSAEVVLYHLESPGFKAITLYHIESPWESS